MQLVLKPEGHLMCTGFPCLQEIHGVFLYIFRDLKVLENEFCPGKSWKLKLYVLESPGIYVWFKSTNIVGCHMSLKRGPVGI